MSEKSPPLAAAAAAKLVIPATAKLVTTSLFWDKNDQARWPNVSSGWFGLSSPSILRDRFCSFSLLFFCLAISLKTIDVVI